MRSDGKHRTVWKEHEKKKVSWLSLLATKHVSAPARARLFQNVFAVTYNSGRYFPIEDCRGTIEDCRVRRQYHPNARGVVLTWSDIASSNK